MTQEQKFISLPMEEELIFEINRVCLQLGTNRSKFVRHAIRFYLSELQKNPDIEKPEPALRLG